VIFSVIDSFAAGTVMHDGWFERLYPVLAIGAVVAGGVCGVITILKLEAS
jgi:hypothetical protein